MNLFSGQTCYYLFIGDHLPPSAIEFYTIIFIWRFHKLHHSRPSQYHRSRTLAWEGWTSNLSRDCGADFLELLMPSVLSMITNSGFLVSIAIHFQDLWYLLWFQATQVVCFLEQELLRLDELLALSGFVHSGELHPWVFTNVLSW